MKQTLKIMTISALATAAIIKAVPAIAEPAPAQNVSIVQTGDLDLTTSAGQQVLNHRLVIAAYDVCGTASDVDLVGKNKARECRADVLASARAQSGQLAARNAPIQIAARR
jgi:UrcA family protein